MGRPKKYKTDEERRQARREYERSPARREYKRQWAINKKKKEKEILNDNREYATNNTKGHTTNINSDDNDGYNFNNSISDSLNLQNDLNEEKDIFQFNKIDDGNTHIVDDNFDNEVIEIEINEEQLKNILSIVVVFYIYLRIYDFNTSNVVVHNLEKKAKYNEIIERITTKCKATIEKYDYLKKLYSNIDDFMFIVDVILLASVIEDEINNTTKKSNLKESNQQNTTEEYQNTEQPLNLFERL